MIKMSEEEAVKILQYKVNNVNNDVYIGELNKQNIEAIKILLKSIEQLQQEKEELNNILAEFEKWLWEKLNIKPANKIYVGECLEKLQELKGDRK